MAEGKCTFGTRMPIDIHMLNEIIYREVKHFRNYKIYRPNFGCTIGIAFYIHCCLCEAEFEIFRGFDAYETLAASTDEPRSTIAQRSTNTPTELSTSNKPTTTKPQIISKTTTQNSKTNVTNTSKNFKANQTSKITHKPKTNKIIKHMTVNLTRFACPEEERPSNIGPYEVPTQRDLVSLMKGRLMKLFNNYHSKALYFLNDIQVATRATSEIARKCPGPNRETYKKCAKHVSNQCKLITKSIVTSLEYQRSDVDAITEESICNVTAMKTDPVELIKTLAMEQASLEFALPGFLRLLSACSLYCNTTNTNIDFKPSRHMTDQDLVVKHFLTRKNYIQLIKDPH